MCRVQQQQARQGVLMKPTTYPCEHCGSTIAQKQRGRIKRYCTRECFMAEYRTPSPETTCEQCGEGTGHPLRRLCPTCRERPPRVLSTTYGAVHHRMRNSRGKASTYTCECGEQAEQWAYDHSDPDAVEGVWHGQIVIYSLDYDHYDPLCRSCHVKRDGNGYVGGGLERINAARRAQKFAV